MKLDEAVQDFLMQKRIAVVGVSRDRTHVGRMLLKKLRTGDREVIPVNPAAAEIEGVRCYPDLKSIPGGVTAVVVVTRPSVAASIVKQCAELGIRRVWLHRSFGAGSASEYAVRIARETGTTLIPTGCPMMFCEPVDIGHRCFRWCMRITGKLPATVEV
jgi:predicted CoA-binding protein